ncbi:hypothetical protein L249_8022 [Ophiocordyceps polyrhachis-furcata BCC 54312]|uniref:MMS19 nucleotide excision repair protein n=1 Tax=Ophiocordyceps polyrhachis-furcata BCC 54312 TaxID=1330021 RepID=A0A367LH86_9HYPO|nr:hypothetical protein L249_8022 [Ophiocordyceps polyrhachis-furcata BCC 54312]
MADFRHLALDFVLEDDEATLTGIGRRAASAIEAASSGSNPIARWVESVQQWMPGNDDDAMRDDGDIPDWTTRAKALDFLSRTLLFLDQDILKPSQGMLAVPPSLTLHQPNYLSSPVNLLVAFFGAMFDVDHKAGIMASATALSRIITMKSFQPSSGRNIIQMVCALNDDFPRQAAKTRLVVYKLLRSLITDAAVARDLQSNEGDGAFMGRLVRLCQNERDPECLMVWLDTLRFVAAEYSPPQDVLDDIYGAFKAYFPITLPRGSQSGLTPEELKLQLRRCFSSNGRLAPNTLPLLLEKLDQGDGLIVNVKIDILRTIRACFEDYSNPERSVAPYAGRTWDSVKYEVRNGDVEDTIWAALEVLKALTTRLEGDALQEFTITVTRECVTDLSSLAYAAAAGRLLVSVLSADARAFALMASPAVANIKENLRHPKSTIHKLDLLKILRILLETRLLLADVKMSAQERQDFGSTDLVFRPLYGDVYRGLVEPTDGADGSYDVKVSTEAIQGVGALVCQRASKQQPNQSTAELLVPEKICLQICNALFSLAARSWELPLPAAGSDELINQSIEALRRSAEAYPMAFAPLMERGLTIIRTSYSGAVAESVSTIQRVSSVAAFVGCSGLGPSLTHTMRCFLAFSLALTSELVAAMDSRRDARLWCALIAGIETVVHYFKDAFTDVLLEDPLRPQRRLDDKSQSSWLTTTLARYPVLSSIGPASAGMDELEVPKVDSAFELRDDFLLTSLVICRHLYRRATKPSEENQAGVLSLSLGDDFTGTDPDLTYRYLSMLSDLVGFVVGEINRSGCSSPQFEACCFLTLFRDDSISVPDGRVQPQDSWRWLVTGPLNVLSWGILRSMPQSGVARLFETGIAQQVLIYGTSSAAHDGHAAEDLAVLRAMLAVLANRYKLETVDDVMTAIEQHTRNALKQAASGPSPDARQRGLQQAFTIFTLAGSLARRSTGQRTRGLLELLRRAPDDPAAGYRLGRGLELVVAPQTFLTDSVQRPLWMQKIYVDLIKPLLDAATGGATAVEPGQNNNYSVAVLSMVKHMRFPVFEADAGVMVRVAISTAQKSGTGPDARAALQVIDSVLDEAPDAVQPHLGSLIAICTDTFSNEPSAGISRTDDDEEEETEEVQAACAKLALELVCRLPQTLEARHLLAHAPAVRRQLAAACGHRVRDLRKVARQARAAWAELMQ